MRVAKRRKRFVLDRKVRKRGHDVDKLLADQLQRLMHNDNIRIVAYIAGGRPQMDNRLCRRALFSVCIYVRHDVMTYEAFAGLCRFVINIVRRPAQLVDLLLRDREAKFFFAFRQSNPEPSPRSEFLIRGKQELHFFAGISGIQRRFIR